MDIDRAQLKRLREFSGRSIRQLAKEAGVSHSGLSYVERGDKEPREATVKKIADALGVTVEDLARG